MLVNLKDCVQKLKKIDIYGIRPLVEMLEMNIFNKINWFFIVNLKKHIITFKTVVFINKYFKYFFFNSSQINEI